MGIPPSDRDLTKLMSSGIEALVKDAIRVSANRSQLAFLARTALWQRRAASLRRKAETQGLHVPPFMIGSVTSKCNLSCKGCYSRAQGRPIVPELTGDDWERIFRESKQMGISIILLAGGEPLIRRDVMRAAAAFPEVLFPVFTNALLVDVAQADWFAEHRNIIPVVSIEGHRPITDERRGAGIYEHLMSAIESLSERGVLFGTSITVTRRNIEAVTGDEFVRELTAAGSRVFFYVEYVPVAPGTEDWTLTEEQTSSIPGTMDRLRARFGAIFIAFPGDEGKAGGCLAAGRGFVHLSASGDLEPCPFAPYSDTSVVGKPLRDALASGFLRRIRENHDILDEGRGGCALWEKRGLVKELLGS